MEEKGFGIAGFVLSLIGLIFLIFYPIALILAVLGLIFSIIQLKRNKTRLAIIGLVINIIVLIIGAIIFIFSVLFLSTLFMTAHSMINSLNGTNLNMANQNGINATIYNGTDISVKIVSIQWSNDTFSLASSYNPAFNGPNITDWGSFCAHATNSSDENSAIQGGWYALGAAKMTFILVYPNMSQQYECHLYNTSNSNFPEVDISGALSDSVPVTNTLNANIDVDVLENNRFDLCCVINGIEKVCAPGNISAACDSNGNVLI